ncbi:hypothetical protein JCM16303_003942 [Sporobolomyces ruberrimus]
MTDYASTALGLTHFAVGATTLVSPVLASRLALLTYRRESSFIMRLFASRELLLGYSIISASTTDSISASKRRWAVDLANLINGFDVAGGLFEWIKSDYTDAGALFGGLGAAGLLVLGIWSSRNENLVGKSRR